MLVFSSSIQHVLVFMLKQWGQKYKVMLKLHSTMFSLSNTQCKCSLLVGPLWKNSWSSCDHALIIRCTLSSSRDQMKRVEACLSAISNVQNTESGGQTQKRYLPSLCWADNFLTGQWNVTVNYLVMSMKVHMKKLKKLHDAIMSTWTRLSRSKITETITQKMEAVLRAKWGIP